MDMFRIEIVLVDSVFGVSIGYVSHVEEHGLLLFLLMMKTYNLGSY